MDSLQKNKQKSVPVGLRQYMFRHPRRVVFVKNLVVLTCTALLMRGIGVAFGSYLTAHIGAQGMGLYSLIMSVYAFAVTFASSGINLAITRLIAEELGKDNPGGGRRVLRAGVAYAMFFGILASVLLFVLARPIGQHWLDDERTVSSLKLLSMTLCPIALGAVFNGYFTAVRRVEKNAIVSAAEQAVKIILTVFLVTHLASRGIEYACLAMVGGSCIAEGSSLGLYLVFCARDCRRYLQNGNNRPIRALQQVRHIALPVAVTSWVRTGLVTLEQILIPKGLVKYGARSEEAIAAYGVIHGMAFPVIFFPTAFLSTFAGLIIPELAEYHASSNREAIQRFCGKIYGLTLLFAVGCSGILMFLAEPIGMALYDSPQACRFIRIFAALIPMMYLDTVTDSILKGLGAQFTVMLINLLDATVCVLSVLWFVPIWGIDAYIWIVFGSEILNLALSITKLCTLTPMRFRARQWFFAPLTAIIGATSAANLLLPHLPFGSLHTAWCISLHVVFTTLLYLIFYIALCPNIRLRRREKVNQSSP